MSTIDKALDILDLFSEERPALGLSEIARLLGRDKASVLRHLTALQGRGFVEQDLRDRAYHLGPALARLALVRDVTDSVNRVAAEILRRLMEETGETAHLSRLSGDVLMTVAVEETSFRGTRVYIDPAEPLALNATGSGIAVLARMAPERRAKALARETQRFTEHTPGTAAEIEARIEDAAMRGVAVASQTFEIDVAGVAAATIGPLGEVVGAVAVATPTSRFSAAAEQKITGAVMRAAADLSRHYGAPDARQAAE